MIKFFRKIRYDLLGKNKTGKYLKYAIGEIILVVIGILIALQINTWNNQKNQNSENKDYLVRLKSEYEYNEKRANYLLHEVSSHSLDEQIIIADSAIKAFLKGINNSNYELILNSDLYWYNQFRMSEDVYDEGVNSGLLFKIENKGLLNEIQNHNALMNGRQVWVNKRLDYFKSVYNNATAFNFIRELVKNHKYESDNYGKANFDIIIKLNPWLLDETKEEYKSAFLSVSNFYEFLVSRNGYLESQIEGSTKLISLINEELEK